MNSQALQEIQSIFAQFQNHPGPQGSRYIAQRAEQVCENYGIEMPVAQRAFIDALTFDRDDQLEAAIEHYSLCINSCTSGDRVLKLHASMLLGSVFSDREEYQQAYTLFNQVLTNITSLDDSYRSLAYTNISDLLLSLKQYQAAYELAKLGAEAGLRIRNNTNRAICLLNMGYALGHMGQSHQALPYLDQAIESAKEMNILRSQAIGYSYKAQIMSIDGSFPLDEVVTLFDRASHIFTQLNDKHHSIENRVFYAEFLEKHNQLTQSLNLCNQLLDDINMEQNYRFAAVLLKARIGIAKKQDCSEDLIQYQQVYIELTDKHFVRSQQREFDSLLKQVEATTAEQEKQLLAKMQDHVGAITQIGQNLATTDDIGSQLPEIYEQVSTIFPTFEFGIALYDAKTSTLDYRYFYDSQGPATPMQIQCDKEHTIGTYVIKNKATVHLNRINNEILAQFLPLEMRETLDNVYYDEEEKPAQSIMLTPIMIDGRVLGLLSTQHSLPEQYQQHHCQLFEQLASYIAISLENRTQKEKLKRANLELDKLSRTEPLTGLNNRYQLDKIAPQLIHNAAASNTPIAITVLDIDYYKGYNDHFGHQDGDIALQIVAERMKQVFDSPCDHLFRYGGDEFLILSYGKSDKELKSQLEQLQGSIKTTGLMNPRSQCSNRLTLSMGSINHQNDGTQIPSFDALFEAADIALFKAKKAGRNQFVIT